MNRPLSDAETEARRVRLASIADRQLDKLARLPLSDRLTVATTILGSVVMEIEESMQRAVLDGLVEGLREHIATGGIG